MIFKTCRKTDGCSFEEQRKKELDNIECVRKALGDTAPVDGKRLLGLAFSGGGIRSATFNLGVVQGLAGLRLLRKVDYLSTVSGGGYIGNWLSAWVHRASAKDPKRPQSGILHVESELSSPPDENRPEPPEVSWLRRFSNYLTPRLGLFSTDTLTGAVTYLRNLLLNQLELALFGAILLLLPWFVSALLEKVPGENGAALLTIGGVAVLLLFAFSLLAGYETRRVLEGMDDRHTQHAKVRYRAITGCLAGYALIGGLLLGYRAQQFSGWALGFVGFLPYGIGWPVGWLLSRAKPKQSDEELHRVKSLPAILAALAAGLCLGALLYLWVRIDPFAFQEAGKASALPAVTLGPAMMLGATLLCVGLHLGLAGRGFRESARELWSRQGADQVRIGIVWLLFAAVALFGPFFVMWLDDWIVEMGGALWLLTTLVGVFTAAGRSTGGANNVRWAELATRIAPYIFIAGVLMLLSFGLYRLLWWQWAGETATAVCEQRPADRRAQLYELNLERTSLAVVKGGVYEAETSSNCTIAGYYSQGESLFRGHASQLILYIGGLFIILGVLSRRIDINIFSFHMYYRNRLERCYLGASNHPERKPHPMTGLDPEDSPRLDRLFIEVECKDKKPQKYVQRPFPIINTALNITRSENLAWQERKAASFTFTPLYCGYELAGDEPVKAYQQTESYLEKKGWISLGTPLTISGAAASPNSGYHTNSATAFLMTLFNVRLGWWLQNSRYSEQWRKAGPKRGLFLLLQELAGSTTEKSGYVYLSDGGHFENLGIYELVRRRCRYIIACDAGCDPRYTFEDLGNAIRKCRIDFGIDIEIDTHAIRPDGDSGFSAVHCAIGRIRYDKLKERCQVGYLLYIKASLSGDEPMDVLQYRSEHGDFPHQTTADQWFSESQFESYRKLGKHILRQVLEETLEEGRQKGDDRTTPQTERDPSEVDLEELFLALDEHWHPPSRYVEASFSKHGEALEAIFETIRNDGRHLGFLDSQIYPEWWCLEQKKPPKKAPAPTMLPPTDEEVRAGFYLCNSLIQLMENVYLDLHLEEEYDHPDNRGWMNLFRHWSWSGMFRVTWAISASTYGARFQGFCRRRLDLHIGILVCGEELSPDKAEDMERLNCVERDKVRKILEEDQLKELTKTARFAQLLLRVEDLYADPKSRTAALEFPVGFGLITTNEKGERVLRYYRIQDHLRNIGLGKRGLALLKSEMSLKGVSEFTEVKGVISEEGYLRLKQMWASIEVSHYSPKKGYRI